MDLRDSVLSSDARLHVNPIHFLARRAACERLLGNSTQSKSKFHHQTCSKLASTTPFSYSVSWQRQFNVIRNLYTSHVEVSGLARAVDARSTFLFRDIIKFYYYIRVISIFFNDLECSLSNICYILYKNNINKNEKTFLK